MIDGIPPLYSMYTNPLKGLEDSIIKEKFQNLFNEAQANGNPYLVIAVDEKTENNKTKFNLYDVTSILFQDNITFCAYKCFDFQNFEKGAEPRKTSIENAVLEVFIEKNSGFSIQKVGMLNGCQMKPDKWGKKWHKQAQWNTAYAYLTGQGLKKNEDEAAKWAWCARNSHEKISTATVLLWKYFRKLATASKDKTEQKILLNCTVKWLKISADENNQEAQSILEQFGLK